MDKQPVKVMKKLLKEYPAISQLLASSYLANRKTGSLTHEPSLQVRVNRVDPELMWRRLASTDSVGSYTCDSGRPGQLGVRYQLIGAALDTILLDDLYPHRGFPVYVQDIFFCTYPEEQPNYLVLAEVIDWHIDTTLEDRLAGYEVGDFVDTEIEVTVYLPTKAGKLDLREDANPLYDIELTDRQVLWGILDEIPVFSDVHDHLTALANRFGDEVYNGGLKELYERSKTAGIQGAIGNISILVFETAGRFLVTLRRPESKRPQLQDEIMFIATSEGTGWGYQSFMAKISAVTSLYEDFRDAWQALSNAQRAAALLESPKVGIA